METWMDLVVRLRRNQLLQESDGQVMALERKIRIMQRQGLDMTILVQRLAALDDYRQALCDLPATLTEIVELIPWPEKPI